MFGVYRCAFTKFSSVVRRCSDSTNYSEQSHGAGSVLHRITSSPRGKTGSAALNRLSKPELQQELRLRGLSDHGKKPELKQRLFDALEIDTPATGLHVCAVMCHKSVPATVQICNHSLNQHLLVQKLPQGMLLQHCKHQLSLTALITSALAALPK